MLRSPNGRYMRSQRDISDKCSCRPHAAGHFSRKCIYRYQVFIILEILTVNLLCCTGSAVSHCCIENLSKIEITGLLSRLVCMIIWHPDQLPVIFDYFWARNTFLTTDLHGKSTQTLRRLERALCHNRPVRAVSRKSEISWSCRRQAKLEGPYSSGIRLHDQENLTPISYKCLIMQSDSRDFFFPAIPTAGCTLSSIELNHGWSWVLY